MEERDLQLILELKRIAAKGNSAEVKMDRDGNLVAYEVEKKKIVMLG